MKNCEEVQAFLTTQTVNKPPRFGGMKKYWFNCKVSYMKPNNEGSETKKTEQFVLDAYTYTEAETRMVEILESDGIRPYEITNITKTNIAEVIRFADCDKWFKVKVALTSVDEARGTEKEANQFILLSAVDVKDAFEKTLKYMNAIHVGYVIPSIVYQKIEKVFPLEEWTPVETPVIANESEDSISEVE